MLDPKNWIPNDWGDQETLTYKPPAYSSLISREVRESGSIIYRLSQPWRKVLQLRNAEKRQGKGCQFSHYSGG